jgi:cobalamin biosynthesis protein CobD/CbiB
VKNPEPDHPPILITDAAQSYEEEFATRKRRYSIMMGMRIPCLVLAAVFYQVPWLAASLIIVSVPLPWMAVLIANDRLPLKASKFSRHREVAADRQLAAPERPTDSPEHPVIES